MVTPSLQTWGGPNFLSSTTFLPLGPRVTPTVLAMVSIPRFMAARASSLNVNCLATSSSLNGLVDYFLKRMSSSRKIRYSVSPSLYSCGEYLE